MEALTMKREHWGACRTRIAYPSRTVTHVGSYPTMEGAISALDPFNQAIYWPLRNIIPYLEPYLSLRGR